MKKKTKFVVEPFDDIRIIGINTGMFDYQLAWNINKTVKINLVKYKDISSDDENFFSFYLYDAGENSNTFNLVSLSNENTKWVSFSPQTDYLLIIRNYIFICFHLLVQIDDTDIIVLISNNDPLVGSIGKIINGCR